MSRSRAVLFALAPILAIVACGTNDGRCLRASDCDDGYACIQGTCRTGERVEPLTDASSFDAAPSAVPVPSSPDATASADAAPTDASFAEASPVDAEADAAADAEN